MFKKLFLIFFTLIMASQSFTAAHNIWSLDEYLKNHQEESVSAIDVLKKNDSSITRQFVLKEHNIPIFYTMIFEQDHTPCIAPEVALQISQIHNLTYVKVNAQKKYLRGVIKKALTSLVNRSEEFAPAIVKDYEAMIQFFTWINEHMKDGVLCHNNMKVHGWIHQMIYAIEVLNLPFLYNWLLEEILATSLKTGFTWDIVNHCTDSSEKTVTQSTAPNGFIFDNADAFYTWIFSRIIFGFGNTQESNIASNNTHIVLIEKNSKSVLDFFKTLLEKYTPNSEFLEIVNEETEPVIYNLPLLHWILKMINHLDPDISSNEANFKVIYI